MEPLWQIFDNFRPPSLSRTTTLLFLLSPLILGDAVDALQVIGGNVTAVEGGTVVLPCKLVDTKDDLEQISWQRRTREKLQNQNFYTILNENDAHYVNGHNDGRFTFTGSMKENNGSLRLSRVKLTDEGTYTCIFALFPSGNHKTEILLNVLVPPTMYLRRNNATLGTEEVSLVTCTAAGSKPPAKVTWLTGTLADKVRETSTSTQHDNGTTTTVSTLFGVPTREISQHLVQCVITSAALLKEVTLPLTTQVYFSPAEVNITKTSEGSFECVTEANPVANFTWSSQSVRVDGPKLQFSSKGSDRNDLYWCEASNLYGSKRAYLFVHVTSGHCTPCWVIFGILLSMNVIAALWYIHRSRKCSRWDFVQTSGSGAGEEAENPEAERPV